MRQILFFLLIITIRGSIYAQDRAIIKGKVYDAVSMESLPGVNIIYGDNLGTTSDREGNFNFSTVPGKIIVSFRFVGYSTVSKTIQINHGDTLSLNIGLIQAVNEINEIVISAGKKEQRMSELTVSMNIIKPYTISENHINNAEEIINKITGIEILDGQASVRGGSGYSYGAGSRVMALVNGTPVLSADAGNIKWGSLPIDNLAQIEVIKGASSVLYGSAALNGVINFITAEPGPEPVTQLTVMAGIYGKPANRDWMWWSSPRMIESLSLSHSGLYENTAVDIGARLMNDNGYRRLNNERKGQLYLNVSHTSKKNEALKYGISFNSTVTRKIDFLLWEDADSGALRQNELTAMDFNGVTLGIDPFIKYNKDNRFKHELKFKLLSNLNRLPENSNNNSDSHSLFSEYQFSFTGSDIFQMISGISQQSTFINSNFYGDHRGFNYAGYLQTELRPLERLKTVGGVRLEGNILDSEQGEIVPVFRAGLNWQVSESAFARASFGQGYRFPSVAEKFAYTTVGSARIIPNNEIKSESGWSSELGLMKVFLVGDLSGQADIAIFYSQNKNMIEYVFGSYYDPVTDEYGIMGFKPVNIENSRVYGIETEIAINRQIGQLNATVKGGYTFMYPIEFNDITNKNTDAFLKYRRKHSAELSFRSIYKKIEMGLNFYFKSKMLDIDDVFTGPDSELILPGFTDYWNNHNTGYLLADINLGFRINNKFKLSGAVKNLTNTEYMGRPGDIRPHRYFSIQFNTRF